MDDHHSIITCKLQGQTKINLYLAVLTQRPDYYHNLLTLFLKLKFGDVLTVTLQMNQAKDSSVAIASSCPRYQPQGASCLLSKTAYLFLPKKGYQLSLFLEKNVPWCSGLGGLSSLTSQLLIFLNQVIPKWSHQELCRLALTLGSDLPLFLNPHPCYQASGRGEILTPQSVSYQSIILIFPQDSISTPKAFQQLAAQKNRAIQQDGLDIPVGYNDFEAVLPLSVKNLLKALRVHHPSIYLSGTGPTFWSFDVEEVKTLLLQSFPNLSWTVVDVAQAAPLGC